MACGGLNWSKSLIFLRLTIKSPVQHQSISRPYIKRWEGERNRTGERWKASNKKDKQEMMCICTAVRSWGSVHMSNITYRQIMLVVTGWWPLSYTSLTDSLSTLTAVISYLHTHLTSVLWVFLITVSVVTVTNDFYTAYEELLLL